MFVVVNINIPVLYIGYYSQGVSYRVGNLFKTALYLRVYVRLV